MTLHFFSILLLWLLPLSAGLSAFTAKPSVPSTQSTDDVSVTEEKTMNPSGKPLILVSQTTLPVSHPVDPKAARPSFSTMSQVNISTADSTSAGTVDLETTTSSTAAETTGQDEKTTRVVFSTSTQFGNSTQSQSPGTTSDSVNITDGNTQPISAAVTLTTTTKTSSTRTTAKKGATPSTPPKKTTGDKDQTKAKKKQQKDTFHSKLAAGLIGGALAGMMVGFLIIFLKRRGIQKQQLITAEWAGPSPFVQNGSDDDHTHGSDNKIVLTNFLPQRLSKRFSFLHDTGEEMKELKPGTTFGDKHREEKPACQTSGKDPEDTKETAPVVQEPKSTESQQQAESQTGPREPQPAKDTL